MPSQYRLIRPVASGGMAQVFEAAITGELGFERRVAVKRILPQYAHSAELRRMFLDEAHIASRLHHSNIVPVLDYGVVDGDEFLVMEYVDGVDLGRLVDAGREAGRPMPEALALHVIAEVAHALDYAHRCQDADGRPLGIVHRDVSPGNILLSWEGEVKLSDFGIAFAAVREARTETGMVKGKQAYMAPEQAMRKPVTAAADIYSLGITLAVTAANTYVDPRELGGGEVSPEVAQIVAACTRAEPAARIGSAELARQLSQLAVDQLGREPGDALRAWLSETRPRLARRRPLDAMLELVLAPVANDGSREFTAHPAAPASTELVAAETVVERPPPRRRWRGVAGVGAVAAVLAAVGVAMWLRAGTAESDRVSEPEPEPEPEPVSVSVSVSDPESAAVSGSGSGSGSDSGSDSPDSAARVALRIESTPSGADVYRSLDGVRLGHTPLSHQIERGDGELALVVRLDGYRDRRLAIPIAADTEVSVQLEPAPRSRRPRDAAPPGSPRPMSSPAPGVGDEPIDPFDKLGKEGR